MKALAAALLVALGGPALAQDRPGNVERVETPQGPVTIVRPTPRAQPAPRGPQADPDPVPPPPVTPFLSDQDGRRPVSPDGAASGVPYAAPYPPYVAQPYVAVPPVVVIQRRGGPGQSSGQNGATRRRFDDVGPVPPFEAPPAGTLRPRSVQPGAPLQQRDGFGRTLPSPRYPPNQYGPGAVPGTVPLPDAADVIILRR